MNDTNHERLGLIGVTTLIIIALVVVAIAVMHYRLSPEAGTVLGLIVGGLLAIGKDVIAALRSYSMSAQLSKVTDQLAASTPNAPMPKDVQEAAGQVADAAADRASQIEAG